MIMLHVVVALIYNTQNQILVAQRQAHKFQGGRWEFPGGKVETNETPLEALKRELHEEVGIDILTAESFCKFEHSYPDKVILLDVWKVTQYNNQPHSKEGQAVKWVSLQALAMLDIPDANWDIVKKLNI
jgi:8-oxo-dGTP diphosphatase